MRFSGGGVVAEFVRGLQKPARFSGGGSTRNVPLVGPFYIFRLSQRGGPGPPGPPAESATGYVYTITASNATVSQIVHDRLIELKYVYN